MTVMIRSDVCEAPAVLRFGGLEVGFPSLCQSHNQGCNEQTKRTYCLESARENYTTEHPFDDRTHNLGQV